MLTSLPPASPDGQVVVGRALKAPADSGGTGSSTGGGAQECDSSSMLDALNALRAEHGASLLSWSADLAQQALDVVAKQADNPSCQFQASGVGWEAGAGAGGKRRHAFGCSFPDLCIATAQAQPLHVKPLMPPAPCHLSCSQFALTSHGESQAKWTSLDCVGAVDLWRGVSAGPSVLGTPRHPMPYLQLCAQYAQHDSLVAVSGTLAALSAVGLNTPTPHTSPALPGRRRASTWPAVEAATCRRQLALHRWAGTDELLS